MSIQLRLSNVGVSYNDTIAVEGVSLGLDEGEIGCLLGPSGCGKTSLLRAIAGFEAISTGEIELKGKCVSALNHNIAPEKRKVGMVFQDNALFPHLTVSDNIGFGLRQLNNDAKLIRIAQMLELISLSQYGKAYPHELSGGQQQRIALARAMAPQPTILLMDEPFSNLDASLREELAGEVRTVLKQNGTTAVMVTHDQNEAFTIADKVAVMNEGRLLQWDTAYNIYHKPADRWVATFVGQGTVLSAWANDEGDLQCALGTVGTAGDWQPNQEYEVLIRPADIAYDPTGGLHMEIINKFFRGADYYYNLKINDHQQLLCITSSHVNKAIGDTLTIRPNLKHSVVFSV